MLSKSQIQLVSSLKINKYRNLERKFVVEGPKMVQELLQSDFITEVIYANEKWISQNSSRLKNNIQVHPITDKELSRISTLKAPNQVLALVRIPDQTDDFADFEANLVLILDDISDPGNMGTIIRTADWFGVQHIICSENCADVYNPKVVQATMGSVFRVKIRYMLLKEFLISLPAKIPVFGTTLDGDSIYETELTKNGVIIIGNESHGISADLLPYLKNKISIPGYSAGAESLNASLATAIVLAEFRRRFMI